MRKPFRAAKSEDEDECGSPARIIRIGGMPMEEEGRRQRRIGVALEVRIKGVDRFGLPFEEAAVSDNISRGGCSFQLSNEVAIGAELEVEIHRNPVGRGAATPFLTTGEVLRMNKSGEDKYTAGVRFTGPRFPTYSGEDTSGG